MFIKGIFIVCPGQRGSQTTQNNCESSSLASQPTKLGKQQRRLKNRQRPISDALRCEERHRPIVMLLPVFETDPPVFFKGMRWQTRGSRPAR